MIFLDIGNTFTKAVTREGTGWETVFRSETEDHHRVKEWISSLNPDLMVVAVSVREFMKQIINEVAFPGQVTWIDQEMISRYDSEYETPKTLGSDRFLGCLGAVKATDKDVLVIDSGTACTIDYMTADRVYRGGIIMPGLQSIHRSLHISAPDLPEISIDIPEKFPGKSTTTSIQWGVNGLFIAAIRSFIDRFKKGGHEFEIFLTGGEVSLIRNELADEYHLKVRKTLLFDGMEEIIRLNG